MTAGEPSGDRLGGALLAGLRSLVPDLDVQGVGGPQMQAQGLTSLFPMEELSVMGIAEVLPKYRRLKWRIRQTAEAAIAMAPDVVITIDSPDFSLRVLDRVRRHSDVHTVHYVAPTVWAWRAGRTARMAPIVDQVLALFPFEPRYMEAAGVRCDFVGHPVVTEEQPGAAEVAAFRDSVGGEGPLVLALPGSRQSELGRLAPIFRTSLERVAGTHPELRVIVPTLTSISGTVRRLVADFPGRPTVVADQADRRLAFAAADVALTKSGTVSLELAAAGTPMVVAHDMNWISRRIIARMLRVDTVTLVNLVSETRAVPEFLGRDCRPEPIAQGLLSLLDAPEGQAAALDLTMERLGRGGVPPGLRAARAVLDGLVGENSAKRVR